VHRFFARVDGQIARLSAAQLHQLRHVLRLRDGDEMAVFDGSGSEWVARLNGERAELDRRLDDEVEPRTRLTLFQAAIKPQRFEFVLQKATEVGVSRFVPFTSERSVATGGRAERWRSIVAEAAEQSGRRIVPDVSPQLTFGQAIDEAVEATAIMPWEGAAGPRLAAATGPLALIVGPEGGFSEVEVDCARKKGVTIVSLGRRVLRSETAAIVAAALLLNLNGDL
jgi:16S rRNA (uracil1498-N3)-methyltransferase